MIIQQSFLRHGRLALPSFLTHRTHVRSLAIEATSAKSALVESELASEQTLLARARTTTSAKRRWAEKTRQGKITSTLLNWDDPEFVGLQLTRPDRYRASIGAGHELAYKPRELVNNPPRPTDITLELLLASQAHMGHSTSLWNPRNSRYIFGIREGIHIISLETTAAHLRRACRVTEAVAESGGLILFVGTKQGQDRCVVEAAKRAKGCHLFDRWVPGSLTNGQQLLGQCKMVVVDELDRELPEYTDGLVNQPVIKPDLVVCLNPLENEVLLHECGLHNVPTIGVIDTDANPTWVTYPIPANDDSIRCIEVIAGVLGRAGEEGQRKRLALAEKGVLLYKRVDLEKADENQDLTDSGSAATGTEATRDKSAALDDEDVEELEEKDEDADEEEEDEDFEKEDEDDDEGFGEGDLEEDSEGGKDRRDDPTPVLTRCT